MADQTFDPRFEALLREALRAEVAHLPLTVRPEQIMARAYRSGWRHSSSLRQLITFQPTPGLVRLLVVLIAVALVAAAAAVGSTLLRRSEFQPSPPVGLGIFAPVAGRIVYGAPNGIWAIDPTSLDSATTVQLTSEAGVPVGWSSDGTRLLIWRDGQLSVLRADGTQTQLTTDTMRIYAAAISPDGSRVFAGDDGLFAVDTDGGPPQALVDAGDGNVEGATFSPDGMRIAYVRGAGDHGHRVWVMDADGTKAQQILANDATLEGGHVHGLAWSPAGDHLALAIEGRIYTFATDGSDFTQVITHAWRGGLATGGDQPYWSPDGTQIAYTTTCVPQRTYGCGLGIANADGSNVRQFGVGMLRLGLVLSVTSGPWHPGRAVPSVAPTTTPSATVATAGTFYVTFDAP